MELTRAQKNALFRAIAAGGLNPNTCELEPGSEYVAAGVGKPYWHISSYETNSWCRMFSADGRSWRVRTKVRDTGKVDKHVSEWTALTAEVRKWAAKAAGREEPDPPELEEPDLWELNVDPGQLKAVYEAGNNQRFTASEHAEIASQLRAIKESLKQNFDLSAEQMDRIEARLDEAQEASLRLDRKDWMMLFLGGIFALILTDIITPDIAGHIVRMVVDSLSHLFVSGGQHVTRTLNK
jgi:hypothetical protein